MSTNKIRIFIIDDDASFLFVLKRHLERKNIFEIHTFNTGEAGIEQLHLNPDILILDYNLNRSGSRMNGREVMEVTKRQLQKARIIMLSGQEDGQLVLELIRQGIREYIVKGINSLDELDEILSMYMSEKA
jgi:DNA-binding NarL/FixJ family response regulator